MKDDADRRRILTLWSYDPVTNSYVAYLNVDASKEKLEEVVR